MTAQERMAQEVNTERTCTKCQQTFPLDAEHFGPDPRNKNGFKTRCRLCMRAYNTGNAREHRVRRNAALRARRSANPEKTKALAKIEREKPRHKQWKREWERKWLQANRDRRNAQQRARYQNGPAFLSVAEAAQRLDMTQSGVRYLIRQGQLTSVRRGAENRLFLRASEVQAYSPRRPKAGQGRGKIVPLDAPAPSGKGAVGDVIADPRAQDPAEIVLRQAETSALLSRVKAVLTDKQRRVLETFAECDLDERATAKECGMSVKDLHRYLTCIQKRATAQFGVSVGK